MSPWVKSRLTKRNARRAAVIGVFGSLMIGIGVAAAAPGSGGQITACYQKSTGAMRVIDPGAGQQCSKNESQLEWSTGSASLSDGSVTGGPGGVVADNTLTDDDLAPNSVGASELTNGAVDTDELTDAAVTSIKIFNGAVTNDDLASGAVTTDKIEDGTVGTGDLGTGAVGTGDLAFNSVTTGKILDGEVGTNDLAGDAVTSGKILDGEVGTEDLAGDAITAAKILNGEVGTDELADNAVTSGKIDNGTIASGDLADGSVTTEKVTANVTTAVSPITTTSGFTRTVASFGHETSAGHKLLVIGASQLTCTCGPTDSVTVRWQVFDEDVPVSQEYRSVLTQVSPTTPATVSALIPSSSEGLRTYQLRVTTASGGDPVDAENVSLSVIDLGR